MVTAGIRTLLTALILTPLILPIIPLIGCLIIAWVVLLIVPLIVAQIRALITAAVRSLPWPLIISRFIPLIVTLIAARLIPVSTLRSAILLCGLRFTRIGCFVLIAEIDVIVGEIAVRFWPFVQAGVVRRRRLGRQRRMREFLLARFLPFIDRLFSTIEIELLFQRRRLATTALICLRAAIATARVATTCPAGGRLARLLGPALWSQALLWNHSEFRQIDLAIAGIEQIELGFIQRKRLIGAHNHRFVGFIFQGGQCVTLAILQI